MITGKAVEKKHNIYVYFKEILKSVSLCELKIKRYVYKCVHICNWSVITETRLVFNQLIISPFFKSSSYNST